MRFDDIDSARILERASDFIWRNARLLERHLFVYHFAHGSPEPVRAALRAYQNADGGFGHALEPDKRCPDSQPVDAEMALRVLADIGGDATLTQPLCDFLLTITTVEGGIPFVLPTVRRYPHAPWWETVDNPPASINPTASIAGLLYQLGIAHPWLERATAYCWQFLATSPVTEMHDLQAVLTFLEYVPDRQRAEEVFGRVATSMDAHHLVARDATTEGYVKTPLDVAPTPQSLCRQLFDDAVIAAHLQALAARQQEDGGWAITWPPVSPACELEWRGIITLGALKTLRAYGIALRGGRRCLAENVIRVSNARQKRGRAAGCVEDGLVAPVHGGHVSLLSLVRAPVGVIVPLPTADGRSCALRLSPTR
jgi:hypothetical protein